MPIDGLGDGQRRDVAAVAGNRSIAVIIHGVCIGRHIHHIASAVIVITGVDGSEITSEYPGGVAGTGGNLNIVLKVGDGADGAVSPAPDIYLFAVGLIDLPAGNTHVKSNICVQPGVCTHTQIRILRFAVGNYHVIALSSDPGVNGAVNELKVGNIGGNL